MPLNHYVSLGRSGLRVSPLCLGAMTFGPDWGWGSSIEESKKILDAFIDRGGNFIDTANTYTKGHSEKIIGDHVGTNPAKRDRLVIATKFMGNMYTGDPNGGGAGRKAVFAQCEQSLRRLKTGYIDLYIMHFWDKMTPIEETLRALDDLVRAGKIRYVGFSDTPAWKCAEAQTTSLLRGFTPIISQQIEYSLLERTVEAEIIPMAQSMGMGITPWSPLRGGVLSGKYTRAKQPPPGRGQWVSNNFKEQAFKVIDALSAIAMEIRATPAQVAIKWVQSRPGVASTIIGARTMEQLQDNLGALDIRLIPQHFHSLDEISQVPMAFPYDFVNSMKNVIQGGTNVNGQPSEPWALAPKTDAERH